MTNLSIHCSDELHAVTGISSTLTYVNMTTNLADPISWGILPPPSSQLPITITIPSSLLPYIVHVSL
jgi:hypothetical protein